VGDQNFKGTIFVEQEFSGGAWLSPKAYVSLSSLYEGTRYTDSQYLVNTIWKEDYDDLHLSYDPINATYAKRTPASGRQHENGKINLSSANGILDVTFGHAKQDSTFDHPHNSIF
jgi:hypothetical protein